MKDKKHKQENKAKIGLERGERKCKERISRREQKWFPLDHQDPQEYIDRLLVINDAQDEEGGRSPSTLLIVYARKTTTATTTGTIDFENKSRMVVADEAMTILRDAFLIAEKEYNTQFPAFVVTPRIPTATFGSATRRSTSSSQEAASAAAPAPDGRAQPLGWQRGLANAGQGFDDRFAPGTNTYVTDCVARRNRRWQSSR